MHRLCRRSIRRFHFGEEGDEGFLLWALGAHAGMCVLMPTPPRGGGAHVRVRWTVADEDRHAVDRVAISQLLAGAAQTKLEGRIVPVVRARAPIISQLDSLADKVRRWAGLTGEEPACVLGCLEALGEEAPAQIAERLIQSQDKGMPRWRARRWRAWRRWSTA